MRLCELMSLQFIPNYIPVHHVGRSLQTCGQVTSGQLGESVTTVFGECFSQIINHVELRGLLPGPSLSPP